MTTDDDPPTCQYLATADPDLDPNPLGHTDAEIVEGDVVGCTAEADVVLRPPGLESMSSTRGKAVFCRAHARYLRTDAPKPWEQCAESDTAVREVATMDGGEGQP